MPKQQKTARDVLVETGKEVADKTLEYSRDFAIGAGIAKTAPVWLPFATGALGWFAAVCLVLALACGATSGIVTFVLTGKLDTSSIVGLVGLGVGGALPLIVVSSVYRRIRRHRLMKAVNPHVDHAAQHVRRHVLTALFGMFTGK